MSEPDRADWTFEQVIEHACSLAIGYGAGRDDLLLEYKATKERALRMARQSRVRVPTSDDDSELTAAGGDQVIADLLNRWEADQGEWFGNPTLEIVAEYAAWRERQSPKCSSCGTPILQDDLTGTRCACTYGKAPA